jgi:uncharacterized protein
LEALFTLRISIAGRQYYDLAFRYLDDKTWFEPLARGENILETPCGSYAHFKLTRYLLRVTRDSRYGDSAERMMYNTILGAKPLQNNGQTSYYADYNFDGKKIYKQARWPCCSGTLPRVAADYRIQAYFHNDRDVFINLYIPSNAAVVSQRGSLSQDSAWPYEPNISFVVNTATPAHMTLNFRIPEWSNHASLTVNRKRWAEHIKPGRFAAVKRTWNNGDRVELHLPLPVRLEAIDSQHPDTVAVMRGPLVLFALKPEQNSPMPA